MSGANIKAVQQLMLHEYVKITLDTYSHLLQEDVMEPLTFFEQLLDPPARLGMEFVPPFAGPSVRCNPVSTPFL